jgi:uncharacterized protein YjiS (DUF1127 family)
MTQFIFAHRSALASRPIRSVSAVLKGLREQLAAWRLRQREREALHSISDAELQDIGISRAQANFEYNNPSWPWRD